MIILFIMVIHFLGAVCAMYYIFHNEPFLAAYLVVSLTISAIAGNLRAWKGNRMNFEEKRELRLQISQMLADAGLNQGR